MWECLLFYPEETVSQKSLPLFQEYTRQPLAKLKDRGLILATVDRTVRVPRPEVSEKNLHRQVSFPPILRRWC